MRSYEHVSPSEDLNQTLDQIFVAQSTDLEVDVPGRNGTYVVRGIVCAKDGSPNFYAGVAKQRMLAGEIYLIEKHAFDEESTTDIYEYTRENGVVRHVRCTAASDPEIVSAYGSGVTEIKTLLDQLTSDNAQKIQPGLEFESNALAV